MKLLVLPALGLLIACGTPTPGTPEPAVGDTTHVPPARPSATDTLTDGRHVVRGANGAPALEGEVRKGKRNGVWTSYNDQGRTKSRNEYVDGVLEGPSVVFRDNGALYYSGQHHRDKQVGEWKFYDEQGQLVRTVLFDSTGTEIPRR